MDQITTKLELNLLDFNSDPAYVNSWAIKHKCPAIVTKPEYVAHLMTLRAQYRGQYKIISAIDFPDGRNFAMDKFKNVTFNPSTQGWKNMASQQNDVIACDGYDILLTSGKSQVETKNEIRSLHQFLKTVNRRFEVRWVLGYYTRDVKSIENMLLGMQSFPPQYIRIDQHTDLPNVTSEKVDSLIKIVKSHMATPLKISGGVTLDIVRAFQNNPNYRFDVTISQAEALVAAAKKEAEGVAAEPEEIPIPVKEEVETPEAEISEGKEDSELSEILEGLKQNPELLASIKEQLKK